MDDVVSIRVSRLIQTTWCNVSRQVPGLHCWTRWILVVMNAPTFTMLQILQRLMERRIPMIVKLYFVIADVRDVALAHVTALTSSEACGRIWRSFCLPVTLLDENTAFSEKFPIFMWKNWLCFPLNLCWCSLNCNFHSDRYGSSQKIIPTNILKSCLHFCDGMLRCLLIKVLLID